MLKDVGEVYVSVYDTFDFTEFVIQLVGEYTAQETFFMDSE